MSKTPQLPLYLLAHTEREEVDENHEEAQGDLMRKIWWNYKQFEVYITNPDEPYIWCNQCLVFIRHPDKKREDCNCDCGRVRAMVKLRMI